jgi:hypothetical protein
MTLKRREQVNKWLIAYPTSKEEIANLVAVADRNLRDGGVAGLTADTKLALVYGAGLELARAALSAAGYRPARGSDHHVRVIESLQHTIGWDAKAAEAEALARDLRTAVITWLRDVHPALLP